MKNIEAMHILFGDSRGNKCKDCSNLSHFMYHEKSYYKCKCYGISNSKATDFRLSYDACGMFNTEYKGNPVIDWKKYIDRHSRKDPLKNYECEGQLSIEDWRADE